MLRSTNWLLKITAVVLVLAGHAARSDEMNVRDTPIKVTATFNAQAEGGYAAQIAVHNGPIANLVHSTLQVNTPAKAQRLILKQVQWRAPYLFVHSSCGGGRSLNCEGEAIFKLINGTATRLGDVIGDGPDVLTRGRFVDVYDKLDGKTGTIEPTPSFVLILDDDNGRLVANAAATWERNENLWDRSNQQLASSRPTDFNRNQQPPRLDVVISSAALARYCNQEAELQALLDKATKILSADELRAVTDALSQVVPLEVPKAWRKPY